jgi:hypothetical protein
MNINRKKNRINHHFLISRTAKVITSWRGFLFACPELTFYYNLYKPVGNFKVEDPNTIQRRIDLVGVFTHGTIMDAESWEIIGFEIKTTLRDFMGDSKLLEYYRLVDKLYIVCPPKVILPQYLPKDELGLIYIEDNYTRTVKKAVAINKIQTESSIDKKSAIILSAIRHISRTGPWPIENFQAQPYTEDGSGLKYKYLNYYRMQDELLNQLEFDIVEGYCPEENTNILNRWAFVGDITTDKNKVNDKMKDHYLLEKQKKMEVITKQKNKKNKMSFSKKNQNTPKDAQKDEETNPGQGKRKKMSFKR